MKIEKMFQLPNAQTQQERLAKQDGQLREAAKMYEQHFIGQMVRAMRQSVPDGGIVQANFAEKIFREQLDNQYVENWANRGGVGLADMIYNHIKEKYFPQGGGVGTPQGPLPLKGQGSTQGGGGIQLKSEKPSQSTFFIESTSDKNGTQSRQVTSPWQAEVVAHFTHDQTNVVDLAHSDGLSSRLIFSGTVENLKAGDKIEPGQKLGALNSAAGGLTWVLQKG